MSMEAFRQLVDLVADAIIRRKQESEIVAPADLVPEGTVETIVRATSKFFGVSSRQIMGNRKFSDVTWPRFVAYSMVKEFTGYDNVQIGRMLGKHPGSVRHGMQAVDNQCAAYPNSKRTRQVAEIRKQLSEILKNQDEPAPQSPA